VHEVEHREWLRREPCGHVITDDFQSAGRISGAKGIPISELKVRSFHTVGNRLLQVNASVKRCQNQLRYLVSMI
jgi:hypothetical protein